LPNVETPKKNFPLEVVFDQRHPSQSQGDGEEKEQAGEKSVLNTGSL
jgi:hypothetical protein